MDFVRLSPYIQCNSEIELIPTPGAAPLAKLFVWEVEPDTQTTKNDDGDDDNNNNKIWRKW